QRKRVRELEKKVEKVAPRAGSDPLRKRLAPDQLSVGSTVFVLSFDGAGTLLSTPDNKGRVSVQVGALKVTVQADELFAPDPMPQPPAADSRRSREKRASASAPRSAELAPVPLQNAENSVDLRGFSVDEAIQRIDKYLDEQLLDGRLVVYLIHGHGTGALKRAVRDYIKNGELIRTFRAGEPGEGGDGVTIAWLNA
ncbi:MAG: Smr/MutS family protein, partial [Myxococcales bacterium]|nr:Smr/MutS family protein [Myxococcales bacterium]